MKKHKKIGVIALFVVMLGVIGVIWYKENVYLGINDVKAEENEVGVDKQKLSESGNALPGQCPIDNIINIKDLSDEGKPKGTYKISGAGDAYKVEIFLVKMDSNFDGNDPNINAHVDGNTIKLVDQFVQSDGSSKTVNLNDYAYMATDAWYKAVMDVTWSRSVKEGKDDAKYECWDRRSKQLDNPNLVKNIHQDKCNRWLNGEQISFTHDKKTYTLNAKLDEYSKEEGKLNAFNEYKQTTGSSACNSSNKTTVQEEDFLWQLYRIDSSFEEWYRVKTSSNEGSNDDALGNKNAYEDMTDKGTKIETLTCKSNSIYLSEADPNGENKLESGSTNDLALSYAERSKKVNDSTDVGKPNLYLFKYRDEHEETYNVYENKQVTSTPAACKVVCTEYLKVNFDPPQAVKGGTCFSYAVQVIAYTECGVEEIAPAPEMPEASAVTPSCLESYGVYEKGAGPNDEYDECISKCDGGKYSEDCSLKCLNKVYGKEKKKETATGLSLQYGENLGKFMAAGDKCPAHPEVPGVNAPREEILAFFANNSSGKFVSEGGKIKFKSYYPGCYWAQYAPFYLTEVGFTYIAAHDNHIGGPHAVPMAPACVGTGTCNKGDGTGSNGGAGFLVAIDPASCSLNDETPTCRATCDATCEFVSEDGTGFKSAESILEDYNETLNSYQDALSRCDASAKCKSSTTPKTSTFTIGTKNERNEKWEQSNTVKNENATKNGENTCEAGLGPNKERIILGRNSGNTQDTLIDGTGGLCYCSDSPYGEWHHYTRWTFPGSWYKFKTGKVQTTPPAAGTESAYEGGYNLYCVSDVEEEVNASWAKEYYSHVENDKVDRKLLTTEAEKYNIYAKTEHFGNYDWTIDMECFYSVYNQSDPPCDVDNDPECKEKITDCEEGDPDCATILDTSSNNIRIKAASTGELLPDKDGDGKQEESFNWSDDASKFDIEGYEIAPGALLRAVEDREDKIYKDENEKDYLDYRFVLTGDDMQKISNASKEEYGKFEDFDANDDIVFARKTINTENGEETTLAFRSYVSNLFRGKVITAEKAPSPSGLRCNNMTNYGTSCEESFWERYKSTDAATNDRLDTLKKNIENLKK